MAKNIVLCCDGTSNEYSNSKTNVVHLFSTLIDDPARQVIFYHPGLGTMGPPGALTKFDKWWTRTLGLAFGRGLADDIRDAYVFLMEYFEEGDKVFLIGFSRGAYTVRSLASVLHLYGLIRKGNEPLVPYAIRMMVDIGTAKDDIGSHFALAGGFKATFSRECKPVFVGVWDTVSSVGWIGNPLSLPYTADNPDIAVGRHAVAIDERRAFFRDNLWRPRPGDLKSGPGDMKQVWFPGSHGDVGGGYSEIQSEQSKFALEWMIVEARQHGLLTDQAKVDRILGNIPRSPYVKPSVRQALHESLTGWWCLAEFWPKKRYDWKTKTTSLRMNLFRRREIPQDPKPLVHESAQMRGADYLRRVPAPVTIEPHVPA